MAKSGTKTFKIGRRADDGRLTSVKEARENPDTHIVESMPKSGHGDTQKK